MAKSGKQKGELVFGFHAVDAILSNNPEKIREVMIDKGRLDKRTAIILEKSKDTGTRVQRQSKQYLEELCGGGNHQGIVAIINPTQPRSRESLESIIENTLERSLILVLDQIQDPHNLGACLRTAECAGVNAVVLPKDGACKVNDTVRKVASGAVENLNIFVVPNLVNILDKLQSNGFWVYGAADTGATSISACEFSSKSVIVMGSEEKGLRKLTQEKCDYLVSIPMHGITSSLNVSVATGVILFEVARQAG